MRFSDQPTISAMKHMPFLALLVFLALCLVPNRAQAQVVNKDAITFTWSPNTETDLVGYKLYFGQNSNIWTHVKLVPVSSAPKATVELTAPGPWYFIVTATNLAGLESLPSNMVIYTPPNGPAPAAGFKLLSAVVTRISTVTTATNLITVP